MNSKNKDGETPIYIATELNQKKCLALLLQKGANVNGCGEKWTPLTKAIDCNKVDCVRLFIENGADLNMPDSKGWTPILTSIDEDKEDNIFILKLLIEKGANVNFINDNVNWTPMTKAIDCNQIECVQILIENGADLNMPDPKGWTPIKSAIFNGV